MESLIGKVVYCHYEVNQSLQRSHDRMERIYLKGEVTGEQGDQVKLQIQSNQTRFDGQTRVVYRHELIRKGNGDIRTAADGDPIAMDTWMPVGCWWNTDYGYPTLKT